MISPNTETDRNILMALANEARETNFLGIKRRLLASVNKDAESLTSNDVRNIIKDSYLYVIRVRKFSEFMFVMNAFYELEKNESLTKFGVQITTDKNRALEELRKCMTEKPFEKIDVAELTVSLGCLAKAWHIKADDKRTEIKGEQKCRIYKISRLK